MNSTIYVYLWLGHFKKSLTDLYNIYINLTSCLWVETIIWIVISRSFVNLSSFFNYCFPFKWWEYVYFPHSWRRRRCGLKRNGEIGGVEAETQQDVSLNVNLFSVGDLCFLATMHGHDRVIKRSRASFLPFFFNYLIVLINYIVKIS